MPYTQGDGGGIFQKGSILLLSIYGGLSMYSVKKREYFVKIENRCYVNHYSNKNVTYIYYDT